MVGHLALLGSPYDDPLVARSPLHDGPVLDPRGLASPPIRVDVAYTGTDPAVGAVLSGGTSRVIGKVVSVDGTANTLTALVHGYRMFVNGETLTNHTAGGTITANTVTAGVNTLQGLPQPLVSDPRTGEVGFLQPHRQHMVARRRREILANATAATFDVSGWEGTVTVTSPTAASVQNRAYGPSTRISTLGSVGSIALVKDGLNTIRPRWWSAISFFWRSQALTNARVWAAFTNKDLTGISSLSGLASTDRVYGVRWDSSVDNDIHVMGWDGTAGTDVDTNVQGASTTFHAVTITYDDDIKSFRFVVYNWTTGQYIIATEIAYAALINDIWGVWLGIEVHTGTTIQHIDVAKIVAEYNS